MPRIPTVTAEGNPGVLRLPATSPAAFGGPGFEQITQFGVALKSLDNRIQHAKDQLDVARVAGEYEVGLDAIKNTVALDPDLAAHDTMLAEQTKALQTSILKANPDLSPAARTTFQSHATLQHAQARIFVAHEGRKVQVHRAVADFTTTQDNLMQTAATSLDENEAAQKLTLANELRDNMVKSGFINAQEAKKTQDAARDRYWDIKAQHDPQSILELAAGQQEATAAGEGGTPIAGMDPTKLHEYVGLAVSTLHARQSQADLAQKREDAAYKALQQENARQLTADVLEGKNVVDKIPGLLRARGLDDSDGRVIAELQTKLAMAPDMTKYQKGLATQIEASLSALKYDNGALAEGIEQGIQSEFLQGHIVKEEFQHLMGLQRGIEDYKHQQGKELGNQDITHAHTNLVQRLKTTGPADKFDALSEQTIAEAGQFFYRRMNQQPDADPWKVMKEAEDIFRPAIEKRLGLSKTDTAVLDDAKMQGLTHTKAISPAGLKAYREQKQQDEGWRIVQEALKNLPPPPPPGFFERFMGKAGQTERKPAGVMGGE